MTQLPTGQFPFLDIPSLQALRADHERLKYLQAHDVASLRHYINALSEGGFRSVKPATTDTVIPARVDDTPGELLATVQPKKLQGGLLVDDGPPVDVYSWVKTDSANPQNEPGGRLWVSIGQDDEGVWWFIGQDCTVPPTEQQSYYLQADQEVGLTLTPVNNTEFTLPTFQGFYVYTLEAEIDVSGVPGNQSWDVDIGLYDETDGVWLRAWDWAGAGSPATSPRLSVTWAAEIDAAIAGHTVAMYAIRTTTTGTVELIGSATEQLTGHELTGPVG